MNRRLRRIRVPEALGFRGVVRLAQKSRRPAGFSPAVRRKRDDLLDPRPLRAEMATPSSAIQLDGVKSKSVCKFATASSAG